jgi:hypothetical protein
MFKLNQNLSGLDRVIRLIIGVSFIYISVFLLIGLIQFIFFIIGLGLIINTITGFCGIYYLLGISTCRISKKSKK